MSYPSRGLHKEKTRKLPIKFGLPMRLVNKMGGMSFTSVTARAAGGIVRRCPCMSSHAACVTRGCA